jgi:hypothetical protein
MTNKRCGRLIVKEFAYTKSKKAYWVCKCDCGNTCVASGDRLRRGITKSCGCLSRELTRKRLTTHNQSCTKLYFVRRSMIDRCGNEKSISYKNYGGRGIKVCDEWLNNQEAFFEWAYQNGYKEGLTLDRIDVNGNYEPSNCRWITQKEQCNNTRVNRYIEMDGVVHTLKEWCDIYNVPYGRVFKRVTVNKMSLREALTKNKRKNQFE